MQFTPAQRLAGSWLAISAVVLALLWLLGPVLTPFLIAAVLAYALTPLVNRVDGLFRGKMPRVLAVVLVEILFILTMFSLVLLIVPILAKEIPLMREQLPLLADKFNAWFAPLAQQYGLKLALDVASIKAFVIKYLSANFEDALGSVLASLKLGGSVALAVVGNAVLVPVALFYLLMDWDQFVARAQAFIPVRMRSSVTSFTGEADSVLGQYLRGQLLVMLAMAVFYSLGMALFGLDLALPITASATLPPSLSEASTEPRASSKLALRYLMTKALMLATSSANLSPYCCARGANQALNLSANKGNCSRIKGISLARIGTISNTRLSMASMNRISTSTTASTRGILPLNRRSTRLTSGVSA